MSMHSAPNINQLWANMIVEELLRHGIDRFVLSPGSRCTPLTVAVVRRNDVKATRHFDERGAAFYALGLARATGKPAVLICTSGTATANYYPAVIEASMDMLPMILLTADRPASLRGTGANQTIDQIDLYGRYVRFFHDLSCPDKQTPPQAPLAILDEAVTLAMASPRGPVHINCQFDEPLAPIEPEKDFSGYLTNVEEWVGSKNPFAAGKLSKKMPVHKIEAAAQTLNQAPSGLVVVGALKSSGEAGAIAKLSEKLGWPIFADIRSGLRTSRGSANVVDYFDQLLLSERFRKLPVSAVIHFGSVMTSKRYNERTAQAGIASYFHVADHPFRHDPNNVVTEKIETDITGFCEQLLPLVESNTNTDMLASLKMADETAGKIINEYVTGVNHLSEIAVARMVSKHISFDAGLFLGSSMPVRDMDMYADPTGKAVTVTANRGASGIDGTIATSAGWANGISRPVTAIVGDLTFLHDVNSLSLLKNSPQPVTIVVINNDGGGIFSFLPIHECDDVFKEYFATPHGLSLEKITSAFGIEYHRSDSMDSFVETYGSVQKSGRSSVIEVVTDREENRTEHLALQEKIRTEIDNIFGL